ADGDAASSTIPAKVGEELAPITPMRRAIAQHMVRSLATSTHAWILFEVDVTHLVSYRASLAAAFLAKHGIPLTNLPFVIQVTCRCLRAHPLLNSVWRDDGPLVQAEINIGVAVAVENGLVVAMIPAADTLGITDLARSLADVIQRSKSRRLRPADVRGSTFTVNNSGATGAVTSRPIINQPEAAIMTMQRIVTRPMAVNDAIARRAVMNMVLSFDNRVIDLFQAGAFMADIKSRLESFSNTDLGI
ncbi:MAG: 2-oxo acid dehydrogenase subunit E2, partial [Terriglobia bacterium]